jgi:hypothetical protein
MNVFITDLDSIEAAKALCDDHIKEYPNKILNIAKNAFAVDYITGPIIEWCKLSKENLLWLIDYGIAVCNIYTALYMRNHKDKHDLLKLKTAVEKSKKLPSLGVTKRIYNLPPKYAKLGFIPANRQYYIEKHGHSYYSPCRKKPSWLK